MSATDFSYSQNPALATSDQVRLLIGDTDTAKKNFTDAEISWFLTEEPGSVYLAAALAAETLAAKYAGKVDKQVGDLKISNSQLGTHYTDLAKRLRSRNSSSKGRVYAGGISIADKDAERERSDRVKPAISIGMNDHPGSKQNLENQDIWNSNT